MSIHRVNVNFSEQAWATLQALAAKQGKSASDVLRDALGLEKWLDELQERGEKLLVEEADGRVKELIFRGR